MGNEDIILSEITRCRKIKIRVPAAAKPILNKWKDIYRFCYNKSVWLNQETGISGRILRDCVKSDDQQPLYPFVLELPTELREGAVMEFSKNLKAAFSNLKANNIKHFKMRFKSRKEKSWCLTNFYKRSLKHVQRDDYSEKGIYVSVNNKRKFKILPTYCPYEFECYEDLPDEITNDFSIYFDGLDYFLVLPYDSELIERKKTGIVTALDPGVRTFQTTFNNKGESFEIATSESSTRLHSLAKILDGMISKRSRCPRRERLKWSRRILKLRKKLKNLQTELHYKTAHFLTKESDIIIIPEFKVKEMSKKFKRKIRTKTVRNMMLLGHSLFKQKLKNKAIERGCQILICGEHYTSKTCTKCGALNNKIGGSKTFKCTRSSCAQIIDRDVNAARNILLRAMRGSAIFFKDIYEILLFKNSCLKRWKQLFSCVKLSNNV
jgi:putative transposase